MSPMANLLPLSNSVKEAKMELDISKTPSFRLDGRNALVVGGGQGIGLASSSALAEAGATVMIGSRNVARIATVVDELTTQGYKVSGYKLDVSSVQEIRHFFQEFGPFDILVNSAGLARHAPSLEVEEIDYDLVMDVNARGAYFVAVEAARGMEELGGGSIIQISSQMGLVGGLDRTVYCASKHAIEGMTKAMAMEWGEKNIRINTICPTFIETELTRDTLQDPDKVEWIRSKIKLGRLGKPEDIMGAVVFLASDASSLVTGTSIVIDGGWTAG